MTVKNVRGRETRTRILEAAAREFASKGFREATTADILAKVGLTQPAFYKHFPNKQAMYDELVKEFRLGFNQLIQGVRLAPELDVKNVSPKIYEAVVKVFTFLGINPNLTKIGLIYDSNADTLKDELAALIAENIRVEQELGYLQSGLSPEIIGQCLVGIIERLTVRYLLTDERSPEELANEVVNLLGPALIIQNPIDESP
ncbi:TetR/AcrR family transcriptional regulator [Alicyclobacillus cycloheptanicus]|uniref:AcrR family transcriptional regulator n=1 Tax=Alicyclobacillus cycloheptanicus TaxID=1457 RepID=A0ABT9XNC2_9BACL|nr:TetR/AcrR family transcriptional regulator [Alicyclobacillus cycloheptanicus]MDQ0191539.1 AcrR family transcriptional regulator [Alicyclobacillus cycloheptanicus]WDM00884.1 TetR/AcrR family transcriptional regulator [Alicyclobacillus cycloheptanicus]